MKKNVYLNEFINEFSNYGRSSNFSCLGQKALYWHLIELEEETGEEIELDIIGLCCDYTEYESIEEFNKDYDNSCETLSDIEEYTTIMIIEHTHKKQHFIIQNY